MSEIKKIHAEVYDLLVKYRDIDPSLCFTLRRSNRGGRLDKGYWFYGNEGYLAVSFWTGTDWKNKTPNIIFVIIEDTKETYLEINTSDSDFKRKFVVQFLVDALNLNSAGHRYQKDYETHDGDYLEALKQFLFNDKKIIDSIIREYSPTFFGTTEPEIYFIDQNDFEEQKQKIERYRDVLNQRATFDVNEKPIKLQGAQIINYGPIREIEIKEIPFSCQWIFFTGENGTGKTSILRALATSLCFRHANSEDFYENNEFKTNITLYAPNGESLIFERFGNNNIPDRKDSLLSGFACYGQSRLKTNHKGIGEDTLKDISHESLFASLFDEDTYLIDLQSRFDKWRNTNSNNYTKRQEFITEILTDILPNLHNIIFEDLVDGKLTTTYIESDNNGIDFKKVTYSKLASGLKSMIAMIGDILVRLYDQQPEVHDPSEFTGIILIDEIDVHLHPKLQKKLVQQLTTTFPKMQFIATTHSPIPFLGAPKNSSIFKVERSSETGVSIKQLDHKLEIGDLLPNTILTSPIFGFVDIVPESHDSNSLVRTEDNFDEMEFNDQVKEKIKDFLTDKKEQELINLFKSRRQ